MDGFGHPNIRLVQDVATGLDAEHKVRRRGLWVEVDGRITISRGWTITEEAERPQLSLLTCSRRPFALPRPAFRAAYLQLLHLKSGATLPYDQLCICTGGRPRTLPGITPADRILTLRDVDSIDALAHRIRSARRAVVVGNGGIAMELVCV